MRINTKALGGNLLDSKTIAAFLILFTFLVNTSFAQLIAPFNPRFSATEKGRILMIGNTLMQGTPANNAYSLITPGGDPYTDNANTMVYLDYDTDGTTFCSSFDTLKLIPCSNILFAGLYWGGNASATAANRDKFKLKGPLDASYTQFTATFFANGTFGGGTGYHAFADVTAFVQARGVGRYAGADAVLQSGSTNRCGGWTLVVVYRNDLLSMRNLTVFDGLANISPGLTRLDFPISGFLTPPAPSSIAIELGAVVYDGDRGTGYTGDSLLFKGGSKPAFVAITDALNPSNDVFNSTISYNNAFRTTQLPNFPNTLGYDQDIFFPNNTTKTLLGNSETSATIRVTTSSETFGLGVLTCAFDVYEPKISITKSVVDVNGGSLAPGDFIDYTMVVTNNGNDPALTTVLSDTLAYNLIYEPNSLQVVSGIGAGTKTDAAGDDIAEYNAASRSVVFRLGSGASTTAGGTLTNITPNNSVTLKFRVKVTTNCELLQCGSVVFNGAAVKYVGQTSGDQLLHSSDPPGVDVNGCLNTGKTIIPVVSACTPAPDTTISAVCPANYYVTLSQYQRPGYAFFTDAACTNPISASTQIFTSGTYYARKILTPALPVCARVVTITVTLNGPNAGPDQGVCTSQNTATLVTAGAGESWSFSSGPTTPTLVGNAVSNMTGTGNYFFVLTNTTTTCKDTVRIARGLPTVFAGNDNSVCEGTSYSLSTATIGGSAIIGTWSINAAGGNMTNLSSQLSNTSATSTPSAVIFTPTPGSYGTITLRLTTNDPAGGGGGCGAQTDDIVITVGQKAVISAGSNNTVCQGSGAKTLDFAALIAPTGLTGTWSIVSGGGTLSNTTATTTPQTVTYTPPAGSGTVTLRLTSSTTPGCPATTDDRIITISPIPTTPVPGSNTPVCVGGNINLTATSSAGATYLWTGPSSFTSGTQNPTLSGATAAMGGTYTVAASFGACSSPSANTNVVVNPTPVISNIVTSCAGVAGNGVITVTASISAGTLRYSRDGSTFQASNVFNNVPNGTYTITVRELTSLCSVTQTGVTVTCNRPPVTFNENVSTNEDTPLTVPVGTGILSNGDNDPDGTALTLNTTPVANPTKGSVTVNANGSFLYTPNPNANGTDRFVVSICDAGTPTPAACTNDTVFITINPVNDPPITFNENVSTNEDTPLTVPVGTGILSNGDNDPDGTALSLNTTPVANPTKGSVTVNTNGSFTYTPNPNANGTDRFIVSICDAGTPMPAACKNDTVFITINPINDPPITFNENVSTNEDTPLTVPVGTGILSNGDNDPDGTALTLNTTPVVNPTKGSVTINVNGSFTYTPNPNANGTDRFIVSICDAGTPMPAACTNDTVFITINPVNDPPITFNETVSTNEDTPLTVPVGTGILSNGDNDPDGTVLTVNTTPVVNPTKGSVTVNTNGSFTYTPNLNANGTDRFIVSICDAGTPMPSACKNDTVFITINPINDPPVTFNENVSTNEDTPLTVPVGTGILSNGDNDPDGTALTLNTTPVVNPTKGSVTVNTNGSFTYTPNPNANGTDRFIVSICDAGTPTPIACKNDTVFITINPINDPPITFNENVSTNEDTPLTVPVGTGILSNGDNDPDGTVLTVNTTPVVNPSKGSVTVNTNGSFTYTPNPNANGTDQFVVSVCDAGIPLPAACKNDTVFITINPINDPPITFNENVSTNEDIPLTVPVGTGILSNGDNDPDGTALTLNTTPVVNPTKGSVTINVNGSFTYTPNPNANGTDRFIVSICDAGTPMPAACKNDTVFITINPVNDPPITFNENVSTNEDTPLTVPVGTGILSNGDNDPDGTALTVNATPVVNPTKGSVTVNANGSFTYTPNANANGTDQFVVSVCDAGIPMPAACKNDTVFITINPVNDPPVTFNENKTTSENTPIVTTAATGILGNGDNDPDGTALTLNTTPVINPTKGVVVINPDGSFTYTPNTNANGTDRFVVSICDAGTPLPIACTNDTVFINISLVNNPPITVNEHPVTNEDTPLVTTAGTGILSNGDTDPDGTLLTVNTTPVVNPTKGSVTINTDGSYTYTPNTNANGTDQFVVSVCDNGIPMPSVCTNDTIFITINPVNDAPITVKNNITTPLNTAVNVDPNNNNSDVDGSIVVSSVTQVIAPANGSIFINPTTGIITYIPFAGYTGTDQFVVNVCDNGTPLPAACSNDTIVVTIPAAGVNTPPNTVNENITINEDTPFTATAGTGILSNGDVDPDGTALTVSTIPVLNPSKGTVIINTNGSYTYTPNANANGTDRFVVSVCDNGTPMPAACANDTIFITITPVNDVPVIINNTTGTPVNTPVSVNPNINNSDVDGSLDPTKVTLVTGPSNGTVSIDPTTGIVTYTPTAGFTGTTTVVVNVCDNGTPLPAACKNDTLTFSVNPSGLNTPPNTFNEYVSTNEDIVLITTAGTGILANGDNDPDGTTLTLNTSPVKFPQHGTVSVNTDGSYTYTPNTNYNGNDFFVVQICDNGTPLPIACKNDTVFISIAPVNDPPVAVKNIINTPFNTSVTFNPNNNNTDVDGTINPASETVVLNPSNGTVSINPLTGFITYNPFAGYSGTDKVVISLCDNGTPTPAMCTTDTLFIVVTPFNTNTPPNTINEYNSTLEDTPLIVSAGTGILSNGDTDPDGTTITLSTTPVVNPAHGTVVVLSDGSFTYTPAANYNGNDFFVVSLCDAGTPMPSACSNDTVFIAVLPVNDAPVILNENTATLPGSPTSGTLATNDSDPDGTPLNYNPIPVSGPTSGTIVIHPDGTYTYTPAA